MGYTKTGTLRETDEDRWYVEAQRLPGETLHQTRRRIARENYERQHGVLPSPLPLVSTAGNPVAGLSPRELPPNPQPSEGPTHHPGHQVLGPVSVSANLWKPILPALENRVSGQNFEIWLSGVRFVSASADRIVLQVQNAFFQEYLGEHYKEVIEEELLKHYKRAYEVDLVIATPEPEEPKPTQESAPPVVLPPEPQTLEDLAALELVEALAIQVEREVEDARIRQLPAFVDRKKAHQRAEAREALEDKQRAAANALRRAQLNARLLPATAVLLRQEGNPQDQRQYPERDWVKAAGPAAKRRDPLLGSASQSAFSTTGPATRQEVRDAEKSLKPKPDSS